MRPDAVKEPSRSTWKAPEGFEYGDVADLVFIVLTLAFFALAALLVGAIDRRWSR